MFLVGTRRFAVGLCKWYVRRLDSSPLLTQAVTTGLVCGLGDAIAQTLVEKRQWDKYDLLRTIRMTTIGMTFTGPVLRGWFLFLDRILGPTHTIQDAMKKVFVDQVMFAPVLTAILLSIFGFSQGMNRYQVKEKLKVDYLDVLVGFYKLWPVAQVLNFYFVPLKFRVNFTNVVSLIWNTYMGYIANRPVNKTKVPTS